MEKRKAIDRLAECVIDLLHEYKRTVEMLKCKYDRLYADYKECEKMRIKAVNQANDATDTLGEIADIIAGFIEHTDDGYIKVYLSNLMPENAVKLERLFKLLDIPMTAEQIKVIRLKKIKIAFKTGEIIRFIGCEVQYIDDKIEIECGRYTFRYTLNDIEYFYI